ncbi:glycosyl transferase family [Arthrobacter sp. Hiyo4]|nr:glycosyl transferase family [Arthrobacter sp. Hiyo4]
MLTEAAMLHAKLFREWDGLAEQYRSAVAEISSFDSWKKTFEANSEDGD